MSEQAARRRVKVVNARGLHARASAKFVTCAQDFDATVTVAKDGAVARDCSIMELLMLAAGPGSEIEISASGPQAEAALEALAALVEDRFGEEI